MKLFAMFCKLWKRVKSNLLIHIFVQSCVMLCIFCVKMSNVLQRCSRLQNYELVTLSCSKLFQVFKDVQDYCRIWKNGKWCITVKSWLKNVIGENWCKLVQIGVKFLALLTSKTPIFLILIKFLLFKISAFRFSLF